MNERDRRPTFLLLAGALLMGAVLFGAPASEAGGFAIFEQDAHATALGGAFTARPEVPSALFYNVAGTAFFKKAAVSAGVVHRTSSDFTFRTDDVPTGIGTTFSLDDPAAVIPHAYVVKPLKPRINFGVAIYTPFDLDVAWSDPGSFPGRPISTAADLDALDLSGNVALRFGERFGLGLGVILRTSDLVLSRRVQTEVPGSGDVVDFASLGIDTGSQSGIGFTVGILHRPGERFSWGLSYRSEIEIDYGGGGTLTQIPTGNMQLDELLALTNPFGQSLPLRTTVAFPAMTSLGVDLGLSKSLRLLADVVWTEWSSFQVVDLAFPTFPIFSETIEERFDDSLSYRLGLEWTFGAGNQLRFGAAFDESPQPNEGSSSTLGPFYFDADRTTLSVGFGREWLHLAAQLVSYDFSAVETSFSFGPPNLPETTVSGIYEGESVMIALTVKKP